MAYGYSDALQEARVNYRAAVKARNAVEARRWLETVQNLEALVAAESEPGVTVKGKKGKTVKGKKAEKVAWLAKQVRDPDTSVARPALEKLQKLLDPDQLAQVLTAPQEDR